MNAGMPGLDGSDAAQQIKREQGSSVVVVLVTASALEEDRQRILKMGGDGLIHKPFREAEVFDALTRHLGIRFVYQEQDVDWVSKLNPDLLKDVSLEWRSALREALVIGDIVQTNVLVDQLPGPPALLDALRARVHQFEFDTILRWLDET
jgi:CheY-like chemotaxis protein